MKQLPESTSKSIEPEIISHTGESDCKCWDCNHRIQDCILDGPDYDSSRMQILSDLMEMRKMVSRERP